MRDILLTLVFGVLVVSVFRYPAIGAYLWAWLSLMNPHKLTYGFASQFSFAQIAAVVAVLVLLFNPKRHSLPLTSITVVWVAFVLWMCLTAVLSINDSALVYERWLFVMKIQLMMAVSIMLLRSRREVEILIWVVTLSIGYYSVKGGVFTLLSGGANRVWGPIDSMVEENNALAVATIVVVPFMYYLLQVTRHKLIRLGLMFAIAASILSILGSQSRGALVAIVAMILMLALKSRRALRSTVLLVGLLAGALAFMPASWLERMDTIGEYTSDDSAMSRVYTWHTLWNLAVDRPLVGGGFRSDSHELFARYAPRGPEFEGFIGQAWVAHSIYFQVLGEQGFVGLGLFLLLGGLVWWRASRLKNITRDDPEFGSWVPLLMPMIQVSLLGFAVGGTFLSIAYFDLPYYLMAYTIIVEALVRKRLAARAGMVRPANERGPGEAKIAAQ